ncbi:hypothetical protein KC874_05210 [Candidatus Saccharibacteria bacterium]|nr:hypothetical protein [Candidatus Saccharibacteria bacterium]
MKKILFAATLLLFMALTPTVLVSAQTPDAANNITVETIQSESLTEKIIGNGGKKKYGNIDNMAELNKNLQANAIPQLIFDATYKDFEPFLSERRRLMATKIEKYYKSL